MLGRIVPDGAGRPPDALTSAAFRALSRFPPIGFEQVEIDSALPPGILSRMRVGDVQATPEVLKRLADAFDTWAARCSEAADVLRAELEGEG